MLRSIFIFFLLFSTQLGAKPASQAKIRALYNSLDPKSVSQHLAFYELYGDSQEGKMALQDVSRLLSGENAYVKEGINQPLISSLAVNSIVAIVNKQPDVKSKELSEVELSMIERLAKRLPNRKLKGYQAKSEAEVLKLTPDEIDLARGLFLTEEGSSDANGSRKMRGYEALIDLMALQILARISLESTPEVKIRAMNDFIFDELGFRFPPHSLYAKDIDIYTFLPAVLDSRRGVCLGVSILYICLAQRLNLPLEMITPPGHIYVRYRTGDKEINIETTARGIHIDSDEYLGIDTRSLQQRNVKEVIGLAHFNQASVFWKQEHYEKALKSYAIAQKYVPHDKMILELMAYNHLLLGNVEEGKKLLEQVRDYVPDHAVCGESVADDYLKGMVDNEAIKAFFMDVDETRASIIKKREALESAVKRCPKFRAGLFSLAVAWLQLHRYGEALKVLEQYHQLDANDPTAEYYLTMLYAERFDFNQSWKHFRQVEKIVQARQHHPKALKELQRQLTAMSPE